LSEANTLLTYVRGFYTYLVARYPTGTTISLGTVVEEGTQREIVPTMSNVTGVGTGSAPQLLAVVCTWKTSIAARRGRGRTFVGPLATSAVQADGTPLDALVTDVKAAAAALVASSMGFGNGALGVYGYSAAKTPGKENPRNPADAKVFRDFTGYAVRDLFASLRSRRD
jgi:hypothetical protein